MTDTEIMKFCQNHWSLVDIEDLKILATRSYEDHRG
jgi:hypothetical protein